MTELNNVVNGHRLLVVDTETTGVEPDAQATEIGWCEAMFDEGGILQPITQAFAIRCKPEKPISLTSMAITHIYPEDVEHLESHKKVVSSIVNGSHTYIVGHNIDFDINIIKNAEVDVSGLRTIDTLSMCKNLYPNAENHKLTTLLHMLDYDYAREHSRKAHSAKHDVIFCFRLLRIICQENGINSVEALYQFSELNRLPKYMPFGDNKGKPMSEVHAIEKEILLGKLLEKDDNDINTQYLIKALQNSIDEDIKNNTNMNDAIMPITKYKGRLISDMARNPEERRTLSWICSESFKGGYLLKSACKTALKNKL